MEYPPEFKLFKFSKLEEIDFGDKYGEESMPLLPEVRFLKFDLCTGPLRNLIHTFLRLTG